MPRRKQTRQFGSAIGIALLALSSVLAYAELCAPPQGSAAGVESAAPAKVVKANFLDRVTTCFGFGSGGDSGNLLVKLMESPSCVFGVLTDAGNYTTATAVLSVPVLAILVAIFMRQALSGFRGGVLLAFVLSVVALFSAILVLRGHLETGIGLYLLLVFLAASFGGAVAHWIVYTLDLLPVAMLGLVLLGLFYFLNDQLAVWVAGALAGVVGGVWFYFRRRRAKS